MYTLIYSSKSHNRDHIQSYEKKESVSKLFSSIFLTKEGGFLRILGKSYRYFPSREYKRFIVKYKRLTYERF